MTRNNNKKEKQGQQQQQQHGSKTQNASGPPDQEDGKSQETTTTAVPMPNHRGGVDGHGKNSCSLATETRPPPLLAGSTDSHHNHGLNHGAAASHHIHHHHLNQMTDASRGLGSTPRIPAIVIAHGSRRPPQLPPSKGSRIDGRYVAPNGIVIANGSSKPF